MAPTSRRAAAYFGSCAHLRGVSAVFRQARALVPTCSVFGTAAAGTAACRSRHSALLSQQPVGARVYRRMHGRLLASEGGGGALGVAVR